MWCRLKFRDERAFLNRLNLAYLKGWVTQEDLSNVCLKMEDLEMFDTGNGPIKSGVNLRDIVRSGRSFVASQTFWPGPYSGAAFPFLSAAS